MESEDKNAETYLAGAKVWQQQQPCLLPHALHTRQEVTNRHTGDPIHTCVLYVYTQHTHTHTHTTTTTPQWHGLLATSTPPQVWNTFFLFLLLLLRLLFFRFSEKLFVHRTVNGLLHQSSSTVSSTVMKLYTLFPPKNPENKNTSKIVTDPSNTSRKLIVVVVS